MLFLLGGKDRRVVMQDGLQYAAALREKAATETGVEVWRCDGEHPDEISM
jgi:hypothetical protein